MAQSTDTSINAGLSGLAVRNGINENLAALFSNSSGASAPSPTVGFQFWGDTSVGTPILRMRNNANSAWLDVITSDYAPASVRSTFGLPAIPTTSAGVGQWAAISSTTGGTLSLPASGTWAYSAYRINASGSVISSTFGVDAGGTVVGAAASGQNWSGFAWRVA